MKIKITCTQEEKDEIIEDKYVVVCRLMDSLKCENGIRCEDCIAKNVEWEIKDGDDE